MSTAEAVDDKSLALLPYSARCICTDGITIHACRRVVGDMVDDMDMKRKKSMALVTGRPDADSDTSANRRPVHAQRSRSSRVDLATQTEGLYYI